MRVFNTRTGNKEEFITNTPGKVGMYVCGVTVYDLCHIGHARSAVVFDVIYRYLKYSGLDVNYVRNFTDVDDKIINKSIAEKITAKEVSQKYIDAFYVDMDALGVLRPTHEPKATENIEGMIEHILGLIDKGHAYAVDGDVYFSVESFKPYGKLSGRNLDDMLSGARVEVDERKKSPMDFALWKSAKPGEPFWPSPWGNGRPGWHIECSVMSRRYIGDTLDIHGGGKDLVFPHHENEVAQSEALTGHEFAKYWMHNGFVNIDKEKMSKSLGNFFTIRDVLKVVHPEVLRYFLISHHYRSPVDYSDGAIRDAGVALERFYGLLARAEELLTGDLPALSQDMDQDSKTLNDALVEMEQNFKASMDDDFNSAEALGHMHKCAKVLGAFMHEGNLSPQKLALLAHAVSKFKELGNIFGILQTPAKKFFELKKQDAISSKGIDPAEIEKLIAERLEAKKSKNWARADEIRNYLTSKDVVLEDGPGGTTWKIKESALG